MVNSLTHILLRVLGWLAMICLGLFAVMFCFLFRLFQLTLKVLNMVGSVYLQCLRSFLRTLTFRFQSQPKVDGPQVAALVGTLSYSRTDTAPRP
jgi:hypothetical protein